MESKQGERFKLVIIAALPFQVKDVYHTVVLESTNDPEMDQGLECLERFASPENFKILAPKTQDKSRSNPKKEFIKAAFPRERKPKNRDQKKRD